MAALKYKVIKNLTSGDIEFKGIVGDNLKKLNIKGPFESKDITFFGITDVIKNIFYIKKKINLLLDNDQNKIEIQRTPEMIYGLRNFIGNAIKFSKSTVDINLKSNEKLIEIKINDDGPGIPEDIINKIGEPYVKSKSRELSPNSGLGLGTFLGKTLLERQKAKLLFRRRSGLGGALVIITWDPKTFTSS